MGETARKNLLNECCSSVGEIARGGVFLYVCSSTVGETARDDVLVKNLLYLSVIYF